MSIQQRSLQVLLETTLEDYLGELLEDMTNDQALGDIEKNRGTIARQNAEAILEKWQKEWGEV